MKTLSLAALATVAAVIAAQPASASGTYVGIGLLGGVTDTEDTTRNPAQPTPITTSSDSNGLSGGAAGWVGYDFAQKFDLPIRTEFAVSYRFRHDYNIEFRSAGGGAFQYGAKSNVMTTDGIGSVLFDIPIGGRLKPYIGGGAGVAYVYSDTDSFTPVNGSTSDSKVNFAWQGQAGMTYAYSKRTDLRLDYRYVDLGKATTGRLVTGDRFTSDLISHDIRIGVQWKL